MCAYLAAVLVIFAGGTEATEVPEPLIWTEVSDPDPNFVPPPTIRKEELLYLRSSPLVEKSRAQAIDDSVQKAQKTAEKALQEAQHAVDAAKAAVDNAARDE